MRYGSFSVETSYQPFAGAFFAMKRAAVGDQAVDQPDVGAERAALQDDGATGVSAGIAITH